MINHRFRFSGFQCLALVACVCVLGASGAARANDDEVMDTPLFQDKLLDARQQSIRLASK